MTTVVYTDGACSGNPGPGGWAWVVPGGAFASGFAADTTNQRMEIVAAYEAIRAHDGPVEVVSDSTYVVNCFRDRWWEGWLKRGWKNSKKEPVANRDLWEPLIELYRERDGITFRWVKGHSGDPNNDLADALAVEAARTQTARSGSEPPGEVGPADDPSPRADRPSDRGAQAAGATGGPTGHRLVVFGPAQADLGGYGETPLTTALRRRLAEILEAKAEVDPDLVVLTGLKLGTEQLAAEAAQEAGVPYVAVQPFPDPDARWPADTRTAYADLVGRARDVELLQRKPVDSPAKVRGAMARRDAWLIRHAHEAIVVWDGAERATGRNHPIPRGRARGRCVGHRPPGAGRRLPLRTVTSRRREPRGLPRARHGRQARGTGRSPIGPGRWPTRRTRAPSRADSRGRRAGPTARGTAAGR